MRTAFSRAMTHYIASPHAAAVALADLAWDWTYDREDAARDRASRWAATNGLPVECSDDCPGADDASVPILRVLCERVPHGRKWMTNDPHITACEILDTDLRYRCWKRAHMLVHNGSIRFGVNA